MGDGRLRDCYGSVVRTTCAGGVKRISSTIGAERPTIAANRRGDIERALRIAREFRLKIAIWGGTEATW
jgi:hypothetical protein